MEKAKSFLSKIVIDKKIQTFTTFLRHTTGSFTRAIRKEKKKNQNWKQIELPLLAKDTILQRENLALERWISK